jgi:large subunit ribosomal protein L3
MLQSIIGKKTGMTQLFNDQGVVVPVTVIDVGSLFVTQVKTGDKDGQDAVQLGMLRPKSYKGKFDNSWLKHKKKYFSHLRDVKPEKSSKDFSLGQEITLDNIAFKEGEKVAVVGTSKGLGFQGVVRRWGFSGGPSAHGSKFHRRPGAGSHMRTQGEIIKGKKFPGHLGFERVTVKGLQVVRIDKSCGCIFIKGAVPGKNGTLVIIKKLKV